VKIFNIAILLLTLASGGVEAASRIHCENPVYQFGSCDNAEIVEHRFLLKNLGTVPLEIEKVRACCGVSASLEDTTILPGSNTVLHMSFSLQGRKGPQLKTIYVISNDPKTPFYKLRLIGRAVPSRHQIETNTPPVLMEPPTEPKASADIQHKVLIEYFYEPGCHDCEQIESELLPKIKEQFGEACVIRAHDIGIETNFLYLLQLEDALEYKAPERIYLIVNKQFLFGPNPSHKEFLSLISDLFNVGQASSLSTVARSSPVHEQAGSLSYFGETDVSLIRYRFSGFTLSAVIVAGLLDGVNPCAISTLVFFISLLAVSKVRNRQLLLVGVSFCLASFLTYFALGFGLLRILHLFAGFKLIRKMIEWGMMLILLILAVFSFRDALRFRKTQDGHDVTLQLSKNMKERIHRVMRRGLKTEHLVFGGLFIGAGVTALESVCTGQVYVPTLVLILKNSAFSESRAWLYLLTYNLMFILPLILVFSLVYSGLRTETLLAWSRKNVVISKILLSLFFISLALLICLI